jgi:hypothetical protein
MTGLEPVTRCLQNSRSTTELHRRSRTAIVGYVPGSVKAGRTSLHGVADVGSEGEQAG